jgi:hypothetical protein
MSAPSVIEGVKTTLVALKMPRALEVLDVTLRGIERGGNRKICSSVLWNGLNIDSRPERRSMLSSSQALSHP